MSVEVNERLRLESSRERQLEGGSREMIRTRSIVKLSARVARCPTPHCPVVSTVPTPARHQPFFGSIPNLILTQNLSYPVAVYLEQTN